jgi:hypothetical protein
MAKANGLRTVETVVCYEEWNSCDRLEMGDVLAGLPEDQFQRKEKA